jgi:hypothetical protein
MELALRRPADGSCRSIRWQGSGMEWRPGSRRPESAHSHGRRAAVGAAVAVARNPGGSCDALLVAPPLFAVADGDDGSPRIADAALGELARLLGHPPAARRLRGALAAANWLLWYRGGGAASTVTAALDGGDRIIIGHVGDSRAHLVRHGTVRLLTRDHHQPLATDGDGDAAVVRLGRDQSVPLEVVIERVEPGDLVVLSTDGMWRLFEHHDLAALLGGTVSQVCGRLGALAEADATEDASAVVMRVS